MYLSTIILYTTGVMTCGGKIAAGHIPMNRTPESDIRLPDRLMNNISVPICNVWERYSSRVGLYTTTNFAT
ncbi:MAG: hypothetical protein LBU24_02395 [Methanocalculaceae archaeon]|nr:hypothetical protein [Methanocalculaceae archaeon]